MKKKKKIVKAKKTRLKVTNRPLEQVTVQIFQDQNQALSKLAKKGSKQGVLRAALDAQGICDINLIATV